MEYLVPRALHLDSNVQNEPNFDTLIGIANPFKEPQDVRIHCFDLAGLEVSDSPLEYRLEPGRSFATTFITNNVFPSPPQNWQGWARIDFPSSPRWLPAMVCLGGGGPTPKHWNYWTPNVPLLGASTAARMKARRWVFPYAIPFFMDPRQHSGEHEYRTGLSITNLGAFDAELTIAYTVGDFYGNAGVRYVSEPLCLRPLETGVKQLHEWLPELAKFNSEGWVDIQSTERADLMMYLLPSNRDYNCLGWGLAPFVLDDLVGD